MEYSYVAYTEKKKLVRGKITAANEEMAKSLLGYGGYEVSTSRRGAHSWPAATST